ncbi:MAG: hypothetical protein ABFD98_19810 [Syntrophobacteraceae bacterium]|nr:Atg14 domain-containing protein [Desulfobacteraceae bacterium]
MKEILGLIVFLTLTGAAVWLAVSRRTSNVFSAMVLAFSLVSGWAVANYDWIRTAKWEIPGATETLKRVSEAGTASVAEIRRESEERKLALDALSAEVREAGEKIVVQRKGIDSLVEELKAKEQKIAALSEKAGQAADQSASLQRNSADLALMITKVIWLLVEAKDEYGAERAEKATDELLNQLDEVVRVAIPDPDARAKFTSSVMNSLPPRQ